MAESKQISPAAPGSGSVEVGKASALSCVGIAAAWTALFWLAARFGPSGFDFTARGALTDCALVAAALLLWRPVFRSRWRVALLAGVLLFLFSYGHTLKAAFLGVPIAALDGVALIALLKVLDGWRLWLALAGIAFSVGGLVWALWPRRGKWPWLASGLAYAACLVALPFWQPAAMQMFNADEADPIADIRKIGGIPYLMKDVARSLEEIDRAPDAEEVAASLKSVRLIQPRIARPRNVHVVLLETLWDPLKLAPYSFNRDPFDARFRKLLEDAGGSAALSPVFGSLTANAEFEVLCGLPTTQYTVFFTSSLRKPMPCLPGALRQAGYLAMASHPNDANFWSRDRAYGLLGFEAYHSVNSFLIDDLDGPYLSDASLFRQNLEMLASLEPGRPVFNYVVTLSSHYPYARDANKRPDVVKAVPSVALLDAYANAAYYTTRAFMDWVERIRGNDPDAIIVAFGDHAPVLGAEPDPYLVSGIRISGTGRTTEMLLPLAQTPLLVLDGARGALPVGTVPMSRLPRIIAGLLEAEDARDRAIAPPPLQATRFQGAVFAGEAGTWSGCNRASLEGASAAYLELCGRAAQRVEAQKIVRDDLARGRQYALKAPDAPPMAVQGMRVDADRGCHADIGEWGPKQIEVGEAFNPQPGGRSAIWMKMRNRIGALSLRVGDDTAPITFGEDVGAAGWRKPRFSRKPGRYPVEVLCGDTPLASIGMLQVGDGGAAGMLARARARKLAARAIASTPALPAPGFSLLAGDCVDGKLANAVVEVAWRADPGVRSVEVYVGAAGEAPKLWTESRASGSATTGSWVRDGQRFRFHDVDSKRLLGEFALDTPVCNP